MVQCFGTSVLGKQVWYFYLKSWINVVLLMFWLFFICKAVFKRKSHFHFCRAFVQKENNYVISFHPPQIFHPQYLQPQFDRQQHVVLFFLQTQWASSIKFIKCIRPLNFCSLREESFKRNGPCLKPRFLTSELCCYRWGGSWERSNDLWGNEPSFRVFYGQIESGHKPADSY